MVEGHEERQVRCADDVAHQGYQEVESLAALAARGEGPVYLRDAVASRSPLMRADTRVAVVAEAQHRWNLPEARRPQPSATLHGGPRLIHGADRPPRVVIAFPTGDCWAALAPWSTRSIDR